MVKQENTFINKDAYLIIVSGEDKDKLTIQPYDKSAVNKNKNLLDTKLKNTVANVALAGITSPIFQNAVSKQIPSEVLGRINSSLFDIMADGKIHNQEVAEDFIGSCTNALDNIFTDLGFPTPSALYSAIMPTGSGVISKDLAPKFLNLFGKASEKEIKETQKKNQELKNVIIVKLKLVTSDQESLGISIPTRKTENNFNIATAINNENPERNFEALIVHNPSKKNNMYDIKRQLKQIRETQKYVDVYICDSDVLEIEILKDCLLSNLDFSIENKNSISCNIGFTKVPKWNVKIDTSIGKYLTGGGGAGANNSGKSNTKRKVSSNSSLKNKGTKAKSFRNFLVGTNSSYDVCNSALTTYKNYSTKGNVANANHMLRILTDRLNENKANYSHKFTTNEVEKMIKNGAIVIQI